MPVDALRKSIEEKGKTMRTESLIPLISIAMLVIAALACGGGTPPSEDVAPPPATERSAVPPPATERSAVPSPTPLPAGTEGDAEESQGDYDTVFPLPGDVQNFIGEGGENMVNFQTSLSLEEAIEFYRQAFTGQGLTERKVLTAIEDEIFSMVFDGWPNDKALVIQGVDLGETTNINIRFEDV
jgi:hypothetical protein